jgi:peptidoglycan/LPS O-acetylase OafA/YrhL
VISSDRPWLQNTARRGWCGVDVFFVLSGFLITWIITAELEKTSTVNVARFYSRRAFRLQPAYFSGLFGFSLLLYLFHRTKFYLIARAFPYFVTYSLNIPVALGIIDFPPYGQAWSLCIEEQFYLCWPLLLRFLGLRRAFVTSFIAVLSIAIYRTILYLWLNWSHFLTPSLQSLDRIYYGTDTRIDTILMGCMIALALQLGVLSNTIERLRNSSWFTFLALVAALLAFTWATGGGIDKGGPRAATIGYTLMSFTAGLVVLALFLQPQSLLSRLLSLSPIVFVGRISYGIYLFHDIIWNAYARTFHLSNGAVGTIPQELLALIVVWFASIGVAWVHYVLVERRFLDWRDKLERRNGQSRVPSGEAA